MDVISWLRTRFTPDGSAHNELFYANQELRKALGRAQDANLDLSERYDIAVKQLIEVNSTVHSLESELCSTDETKILAVAQLDTLQKEINYLKGEIKIYQQRLGLLPQERQGEKEEGSTKPLRSARLPFSVAQSRIETKIKEKYWQERAEQVSSKLQTEAVSGRENSDAAIDDTGSTVP